MQGRSISQQKIARDLGVSQALVSLVLNGKRQNISAASAERIWKYAVKRGYRPKGMQTNGNGLAGITVALENGTSVKTDANGNFTIFASPGNHTLTISGPGIETRSLSATITSSGLVMGNVSPVKATDYLPIILALVVVVALLSALFLLARRRKKK